MPQNKDRSPNTLPHHIINEVSQDTPMSALQYLCGNFGSLPINKSKLGINPGFPTKVIYVSDELISKYESLTVLPNPGRVQNFPLTFVERIKRKGKSIEIYWTSPEGKVQKPTYFSSARFYYTRKS